MFSAPEIDWAGLSPILVVLGAGVVGVVVESFVPAKARRVCQLALTLAATATAAVLAGWLASLALSEAGGHIALQGAIVLDGPALVLQAALAAMAFVALLVIAERTVRKEDAFAPQAAAVPGSDYEAQARSKGVVQTEVYPLLMFALGGMLVFPAAGDLLTMFVALEVLSLPLYLLSGMARRRRLLSQEASLKYFLLGAFSSAFFLFGTALVYGYAGSVRLVDIGTAVASADLGLDWLLLAGVVLIAVGLLFKVGAVPFHSWTPDVYQGAPTPITGFMAACTKVAAFGALLRVVYVVVVRLEWDVAPVLWTVAVLTMVVGTVIAVVQTDIKRMLAYSAIAHAGFILTGVTAMTRSGISSVLFYLTVYGFTTIGAFALVSLVREQDRDGNITGEAGHITQWAGLGRRSPVLATTFALFLLAFAGIPLTSGFIAKFGVFSAAIDSGAWPLAIVGVVASAAAAFFYARIIVLMFFTEPSPTSGVAVRSEGPAIVAVTVCALVTLAAGLVPGPLLTLVGNAATFIP